MKRIIILTLLAFAFVVVPAQQKRTAKPKARTTTTSAQRKKTASGKATSTRKRTGNAACKTPDDYVKVAKVLDRAAKTVGVNFLGGYSAVVSKGREITIL